MTKTILILSIAAAFIAGSIATGTIAFAQNSPPAGPLADIQAQIDALQTQIDNIESPSFQLVSNEATLPPGAIADIDANCPPGFTVTGGGFLVGGSPAGTFESAPFSNLGGWHAFFQNEIDSQPSDVTVYAICIDTNP